MAAVRCANAAAASVGALREVSMTDIDRLDNSFCYELYHSHTTVEVMAFGLFASTTNA